MRIATWHLVIGTVLFAFFVQISLAVYQSQTRRTFSGANLDQLDFREVSFRNIEQQLDLAGMLFLPATEEPFPAAVIIHGSGASNRENRWYLTLVEHLQREGIAVLLPDKRGSEQSQGDWRSADFHDLATDTVAALRYLREHNDLPISKLGIIGMSQGGKYAPLVATMTDDLDFVINVVGSAVLPREQLLYEENLNLQQMGIPPGFSFLLALASTSHIRNVRRPEFWSAVGDFNPIDYWRDLDMPALILYGEDDTNVPTAESVSRLEAVANPAIQINVYEGSGHALEEPPEMGDRIFRSDALQAISEFIR